MGGKKRSLFMKLRRGFKAVEAEKERREKEGEKRKGALWNVFFPNDADEDYKIPITFLTDEPIPFNRHTVPIQGKYNHFLCTADDGACKHCDAGHKPQYVGAFLVWDSRPFEVDEKDAKGNKTGKKITKKGNVKILVRGLKDLAVLKKRQTKYGLLNQTYSVEKSGTGNATVWDYQYDGESSVTAKEIESSLPEALRTDEFKTKGKLDYYKILEHQILLTVDDSDEEDEDIEDYEEEQSSNLRSVGSKKSGKKEPEKSKSAKTLSKTAKPAVKTAVKKLKR